MNSADMQADTAPLRPAFSPDLMTLSVDVLRPHRPLPVSAISGKKYLQVLASVYSTLRWLTPLRQIEAAELMCSQANFTSAFAKAIRSTTPVEQLVTRVRRPRRDATEASLQIAQLEHEIATLEASHSEAEETYSVEHFELAVSLAFIARLLNNDAISTWLHEHYDHLWGQLEAVASEAA
ncbi:hypothetical protein LMG28727_01754 [Paraburkholderia kirstenboschensis]|uniref:plasmid partitioning protein RepB C-terminal domain-containing protein n=1 Tax=Paraburkholderia kirstenboschensis TaxID=1245436 RepID=UPI00191B2636|nr:plasmid partitioning protein RepB C-terminal domain-containing protein [Paraburkholderia kirstenboschensis]CAD6522312.1 hypothetical protein LMG28727_01754 [Paraburkholderia kirstenboschensis]